MSNIVRIIHGEVPEAMSQIEPDSIDACVTDPPYHLTAGKKGGSGEASVNLDSPYGRARITTGFMGKKWDGGDVAFRPETWRAVLRVLKPGAHLVAFGGSRTYHRLACAVEDGGFEIRDQIMWLYGSGFPKSLNLEGEWDGWGTALKPAHEPIILARKPLIGTVEANLARYGTGALNIEKSRIYGDRGNGVWGSSNAGVSTDRSFNASPGMLDYKSEAVEGENGKVGRWPANVIHDGSDEIVEAFEQFGTDKGAIAPVHRRRADKFRNTYGTFKGDVDEAGSTFQGDSGTAARFFYCAKATKADRDDGLGWKGPSKMDESRKPGKPGGDNPTNRGVHVRHNNHPTVKPTELMRYLCSLVTPRGGVVLDPFMGSGSTGRGAVLAEFGFVGIEREAEYVEIARDRIRAIAPLFVWESYR